MSTNNKGPDETDGVWKSRLGSPKDQGPCQRMLWNTHTHTHTHTQNGLNPARGRIRFMAVRRFIAQNLSLIITLPSSRYDFKISK